MVEFRDVVKKYTDPGEALGRDPDTGDVTGLEPGTDVDPVEVVTDPAAQAALSATFAPLGWIRTAVKPADESVSASTTLQDDDDLSFLVGANEVWSFRAVLYVTGPGDADMKVNVSIPSGATRIIGIHATAINQLNQGNATIDTRFDDATGNLLPGTPGEDRPSTQILTGVVWTGANAGSVTLRWAQLVSNATALTVRRGSHIVATRIE